LEPHEITVKVACGESTTRDAFDENHQPVRYIIIAEDERDDQDAGKSGDASQIKQLPVASPTAAMAPVMVITSERMYELTGQRAGICVTGDLVKGGQPVSRATCEIWPKQDLNLGAQAGDVRDHRAQFAFDVKAPE
jgi:hypothetical protein